VQEQGLADTWEQEWVVMVEQAQAQELGSVDIWEEEWVAVAMVV